MGLGAVLLMIELLGPRPRTTESTWASQKSNLILLLNRTISISAVMTKIPKVDKTKFVLYKKTLKRILKKWIENLIIVSVNLI